MILLSRSIHSIYQDFVEAHLDHVEGEYDGTPLKRKVGGRGY